MRVAPGPESAPTFEETGTVTREVAERTPAIPTGDPVGPGDPVGDPVVATAANEEDALSYNLEGSDAQYFNIDNMGQIMVGGPPGEGTDPELDYDDPMKKQRFSVTVKVEVVGGAANQKAEADVIIMVTDVDEPPEITDVSGGDALEAVNYPEIKDGAPNTAAIATYVGTDPEGDTISWDLRGADAALFTIPGGVLQFKAAPDYENRKDKDGDDEGEAGEDTATPTADAGGNTYSVVVRAIASRVSGDTGPAETVDTPVTVTVTDVDEGGEVVISWLQPEVEIEITASLTDPDGPADTDPPITTAITTTTWAWEVSEVAADVLDIDNEDHWGTAPGTGADEDGYTPTADDVGKYLRVMATYTDNDNDDDDTNATKTARMMSANPVQALGGGSKNESPDFEGEKVERSVAETAAVGDDVPGPVVATVRARSDTDMLTYSLEAFEAGDEGSTGLTFADLFTDADAATAELDYFDIDKATGQITVAQKLDFENRGDPDDGKYVVVARVTDPSGLFDTIVVIITAEDRNEDPVLSGRPELTINEINSGEANAANPPFVGNTAENPTAVNVYNVVDQDRRSATDEWRLEGEDKDQFQLIGNVGRTLVFRNQPDYENPADADGDNVYKVTVVTFDGDGGRGEFDVCIAVMNIEEAGKITLFDENGDELDQPHALGPITAVLTDPDGGVTGLTWQWERSQVNPPTDVGDNALADIEGATSATYEPTKSDTSYFLKVTATYMDAKNDVPTDPPTQDADTADRTAEVTAAHAVLGVEDLKRPPAFKEGGKEDGDDVESVEVTVAENSPSDTYVGEPIVAAVDPDRGTTITYTLGDVDEGEDAQFFELVTRHVDDDDDPSTPANNDDDDPGTDDVPVNTRQLRVMQPLLRAGTGQEATPPTDAMYDPTDLNHEDDKKNSYTVELKASDGSPSTDDATLMVTITVTDRNEAPSTPTEAEEGAPATPVNNAPEFAAETDTREVAENTAAGMNIGAAITATDADDDTLTYSLSGDDAASFDIDTATGQLMTSAALDFETQASYTVEVTASDGTDSATVTVTIMVTDLDEDSAVVRYDADNDGDISRPELLTAIRHLLFPTPADPVVTRAEVLELIGIHLFG